MRIRPLEAGDHPATADPLGKTFRPFFEGYARPLLGEEVFHHQHGHWEQDYREELPALHVPDSGRYGAVGRRLCEHAIGHMRTGGVEVVEIGTGGDPFHAPARALYEALGFIPIPTAAYLRAI